MTRRPSRRWLFRLLLFCYPPSFRRRYGADLLNAFDRDRGRPAFAGLAGGCRFWRHTIADTIRTAWTERRDRSRPRDPRREASTIVGHLRQDLRVGWRRLWRRPGFTALAAVTLALGIGANTAIFSVVHAVLLQPLPYPDADRLVILTQRQGGSEIYPQLAYLDYTDIGQQSPDFESLTALLIDAFVVRGSTGPVRANGLSVTPGFFATLGVRPSLGRDLAASATLGAPAEVVVVSDSFWREHLDADAAAIGRAVVLDGDSYTVIGVLPPSFDFRMPLSASFSIEDVDVYRPLDASEPMARNRAVFTYEVIGRLKAETTRERARAGLDTIAGRLETAYPATNTDRRFGIVPLHEQVVGRAQPALLALLAATGLVLMLAGANLGSLLLAQATGRHRELSLRAALGANRGRLLQQLTVESLLLAVLGGAAGLVLATWVQQTLIRLPGIQIPRIDEIGMSPLVITVAVALTAVTALAAGLLQAAAVRPAGLAGGAGAGGRATTGRFTSRLRSSLVAAEVAIACVLLLGSTLLLVSLARVLDVSPGFDTSRLLSMRVTLTGSHYDTWQEVRSAYRELEVGITALPGVERVTLSGSLPLSGHSSGSAVRVEGRPLAPAEQPPSTRWQAVFPDYFETMGIPVIRGRDFSRIDEERADHQTIVSASLARMLFPGEDAIGKRVYYGPEQEDPDWHEIVGIAGDVRHSHLETAPRPHAYDLYGQHPSLSQFVIIRTERDAGAVLPAVRRVAREIDPDAPVHSIATLDDLRARSVAPRRYLAWLVGAFAGLAALLFVVGLYGVLAESVERRRREIGVRMALGAQPRDVGRLVVRQGLTLALVGLLIGFAAMTALGSLLDALLYGVGSTDARLYAGVGGMVIVVTLVACWVPARRAMRADPIAVLRAE